MDAESKEAEYGFESAVRKHFAYLCTEYGFRSETQHLGIVTVMKFVSDDVSVELWHVPQHREIESYVISNKANNAKYEIEEVIILNVPGGLETWRFGEVRLRSEIEENVKGLAEMLKKYGQKLLRADSAEFKRLAKQQKLLKKQQGM